MGFRRFLGSASMSHRTRWDGYEAPAVRSRTSGLGSFFLSWGDVLLCLSASAAPNTRSTVGFRVSGLRFPDSDQGFGFRV